MMTSNMPLNSKQVLACCEDFSALQVPILLHKNVGFCIKIKKNPWDSHKGEKDPKAGASRSTFHIFWSTYSWYALSDRYSS